MLENLNHFRNNFGAKGTVPIGSGGKNQVTQDSAKFLSREPMESLYNSFGAHLPHGFLQRVLLEMVSHGHVEDSGQETKE